MPNNKKTAICFTGTCRALQFTHENIKNNLIFSNPNCDLFFFITKNKHSDKINEYFKDIDNANIIIDTEDEEDLSGLIFKPLWPNPPSTHQIFMRMLRSRKKCAQMLEDYTNKHNIEYNVVGFSRLDVKYFNMINLSLFFGDDEALVIPDFHSTYGNVIDGYNDRFAIGTQQDLVCYLNAYDSARPFVENGGLLHAETLLKWHLQNNGVNVKSAPIRFTRVRGDGEEIDLRIEHKFTWRRHDT
tara:strand:- start:6906 stop:7634 length:729 start_codon:yes stop_codon:yes gene_type:complete